MGPAGTECPACPRRVPAGPCPLPGVSPSVRRVPRGRVSPVAVAPGPLCPAGPGLAALPRPALRAPPGRSPRYRGRIAALVCAGLSLRAAASSGYGLALPALKGTTELIRLGSFCCSHTPAPRKAWLFFFFIFSDSAGTLSMFVQKIKLLELSGKKQ